MDQSDKEKAMKKVNSPNLTNPDYVYPRTLDEAFGERGPVVEKDEEPEMRWDDKLMLWVAPAIVIFILVLFVLEN
jgi:hypothetical protein